MLTQKDVFNIYDKYNVSANKRFGQNFLVDHNILDKIIEAGNVKNKDVIEIGPGLGSLTIPLLDNAKTVTSYEIDEDMIRVLKGEINNPNFNLIEGDFLKASFDWEGKKTVVANIPYNITSDILFTLFKNTNKFDCAVLMMQKEVAERLIAPVGSKQYGKLTISTDIFAEVSKVTLVSPKCFIPAPKVTSMVVKLDFKNNEYLTNVEFLEFIKKSFTHRRKTFFNNLKLIIGPERAIEIIKSMNFKESIRPQEISPSDFKKIFDAI